MEIPLEKIQDPFFSSQGITLSVLRLDRIHPRINGNKYFKLKYNLEEMRRQGLKQLLTFGGAFSNHIAAVSAAGKEYGFKTIGVIRGDELNERSNPVLKFASANGMLLHFVPRDEYRRKNEYDFIKRFEKKYGKFYLLPEGGSNELAVKGCSEILGSFKEHFDFICCPVGTGATLAGIAISLSQKQQAVGFVVLADAGFLDEKVNNFMVHSPRQEPVNVKLIHDYHFGRYARSSSELDSFIEKFEKDYGIPLDHVYTGKMLYGIFDLVKKGFFVSGEKILAVHTGGQGENK